MTISVESTGSGSRGRALLAAVALLAGQTAVHAGKAEAERRDGPAARAARPPAPPPYRKAAPLLVARPRAGGQPLRAGRDAALLRRLERPGGKEVKLPGNPADWELILCGPERERVYRYWERPGVLAELAMGKHLPARGRRVAGLGEALRGLPVRPRPPATPVPFLAASMAMRGEETFASLFYTHTFLGRVVDVVEVVDLPSEGLWKQTVYLVEVLRAYRWDTQPQRYVRLRWPGSQLYENGAPSARLSPGGLYFLFTGMAPRLQRDEWGNEWHEDHGEVTVWHAGGGPKGMGIVRVRDGVTVPGYPWLEAWLAREIAEGRGVPHFIYWADETVTPAWGLSFAQYDALLQERANWWREDLRRRRQFEEDLRRRKQQR